MNRELPRWADLALLPALNLLLALGVSALVVLAAGESPAAALQALAIGSFGSWDSVGYTLFYATDMAFAGLAVAIAFKCGLFNIGVEGQAAIGGLGLALVMLGLDSTLPAALVVILAVAAGALAGAAYGAIPGWLQARRGSHVVITTIMFNFIAASLLVYLLVNVLIEPGQMAPETRRFAVGLPPLSDFGFPGRSPVNLALPLALLAALAVWVLVWRTPWGYGLRVVGSNPDAAAYAGIDQGRRIIAAMAISGALAAGIAVNELLGSQDKLILNFTGGAGFTGIAVALMGRNHPVGVLLAALLFGALAQGGAELAFEMPDLPRETVMVVQGLVILFTGALGALFRAPLSRLLGA
ncbi:sugar ABC transporter permease [Falsiroseomonas bella]|uniref:Sugar ABC transporter permease n=1 Tax=Falsiroseomonas bella TaxID=2184016 RepID=A0A317FBC2_9PROT|nr:ABC transporter permease [Falsiroseomonas bella]PWS35763.1 sugar ABC transporter permease [Falsiroseomonas bella]